MARSVPNGEPCSVTAGDSWVWTKSLGDFAPTESGGTWALSYAINGKSVLPWSTAYVTDDGSIWTVTIPATVTLNMEPGRYEWSAIVTGGGGYSGERYVAASGVLAILANPATAGEGDRQTFAERTLAVVEAVLEGRASSDMQSYQIGGRSVVSIPFSELYAMRNKLRVEVFRERNPGQATQMVRFAFRQPSS
jgi:hypothetical protein